MMTTWCVDISGSMSKMQIGSAFDRVSDDWKIGDAVIIFDHSQAEFIGFDDVVEYSFGKDPHKLQMDLFKRGTYNKWRSRGPDEALRRAFNLSMKVCLTDGFLVPEDIRRFGKMIIFNHHGKVIG